MADVKVLAVSITTYANRQKKTKHTDASFSPYTTLKISGPYGLHTHSSAFGGNIMGFPVVHQ